MNDRNLAPELVLHLASILQLQDGAFIVGGQALNIWAERFSAARELEEYGPFTSKDLDYFGYKEAAQKLANALGGRVLIPSIDNATPQTAIVEAEIQGQKVEIDFLNNVLGVRADALTRSAVELILTVRTRDGEGTLTLPIMHPLHVMQSRIANVLDLGRKSDLATRQLKASPIVVREYVNHMLDVGNHREATATLEHLFEYLRSHPNGRQAQTIMTDPGQILDYFSEDARIDERYRTHTLTNMRKQLKQRRSAWADFAARLSLGQSR